MHHVIMHIETSRYLHEGSSDYARARNIADIDLPLSRIDVAEVGLDAATQEPACCKAASCSMQWEFRALIHL